MFTSGSTGEPKGVMVTHRNIECNTRDIIDYMKLIPTDRAMLVLPLHYCFGLSVLHSHLLVGASMVINNQFLYPETVVQDMHAKRCTGLAGVPSTYQILLRKSRFKSVKFPALRWLQQAGGRLPKPYISEIRHAFPDIRFFIMYGQTEATARLSFLPPERLGEKLGSIGRGLASTHLEVLKADGTPVEPEGADIGEIVASGDNITAGYWNDPVETARYFRDGRLYTGDLARVDSDGFIFIVDRARDMIKSGGNRVSAKEIEDAICELPDVVEAAVIGVPDAFLGEAIAAFVVLIQGAQIGEEAIRLHCRQRLAAFKIPHHYYLHDRLPHNSSGKVLKNKLRERALRRAVGAQPDRLKQHSHE
jgi:acyl-CoA synthetase (AMP-forming)/AMP-acid ligase II